MSREQQHFKGRIYPIKVTSFHIINGALLILIRSPLQLCALSQLGCTREADTSQYESNTMQVQKYALIFPLKNSFDANTTFNHKEEKIALMYFLFLCLKVGFAFCTGSSSFRKMMSITMEFIDMENIPYLFKQKPTFNYFKTKFHLACIRVISKYIRGRGK